MSVMQHRRVTEAARATRAATKQALVTLAAALLLALALLFIPTGGDGTLGCQRSPVSLLETPAKENAQLASEFFDLGTQCNREAQRRAVEAVGVGVVGGFVVSVIFLRTRKRQRTDQSVTGR